MTADLSQNGIVVGHMKYWDPMGYYPGDIIILVDTLPEIKTLPVTTYARLVEDAVQRRALDTLVTTMQDQIRGLESIQAQLERNMNRQLSILSAENQALEIQTAAWESKYGVLEKENRKKQRGNKWLKVAVGAAFVLGLFAGK